MIQEDLFYLLEKYRPDIVAIENLYFCKNVKTAIDVGQARGIILLEATRFKVPILEFTPTQVKMAVAGYGRASKQQIQKMMQTLLSLPSIPKPDDAADALALAVCCGYTSLNLMKIVDSEFKSKPAEDGVKKSKNLKIKKTKKTTKKVAASKKPKKVTIKKSKKESKVKPKKVVKKKK